MKDTRFTVTLCHKCKEDFESTGENYIRRDDPMQIHKEKCTYCNTRNGYDYVVTKRPKGKRR